MDSRDQRKICVLTGATSGIGKAAAFQLAERNTSLILISRNVAMGGRMARRLCARHGPDAAVFFPADLSRFEEVRRAVLQVQQRHSRIDILINNAGARYNEFQTNGEGIERTFAANHLGHFLLTLLLLDLLKASPAARIIHVSSDVHAAYTADFEGASEAAGYDRKAAYGRSKLANLLFTYELARRLAGGNITSNALHPGGVATNLGRNNGLISWARHYVYYLLKRQLILPSKAAETIVYLALSEEVQGVTGRYFFNKKETRSSDASQDPEAARRLWDLSAKLCRL